MKKTLFTIITIVLITVGCAKQKGCTEPNAINYDTAAEENDGTCVYSSSNYTTSTNTGSTSTNTGSTTTNTSNTSSNTTNQNNLLGQVDITASWEMRSIIGSNICVN
ncbi:MAG: hypothetical protein HRT71_13075, partial [Flavobacteriales bacterium]|nr:hypothetical protein [Flavobacteriales bacterium]